MTEGTTTMPHLWEMDTHWFNKNQNEYIQSTFPYKSWKDFIDCKPYKLWKPYILSSWAWKSRLPQEIVVQKKRESERYTMECNKILHLNPSNHTNNVPLKDESKEPLEMLQIVFLSPERFTGVHRVEILISKDDEAAVKDWLSRHMPTFWKLD